MKSRKITRPLSFKLKEFYRILYDYEHVPIELDKYLVDTSFDEILTTLKVLSKKIEDLYNYDYDIYELIFKHVYDSLDISDGKSWRINTLIRDLEELKEKLDNNADDIKEPEQCINLEDLGFKPVISSDNLLWEKVLEDTDEKEIVEEIIMLDIPKRRKREIIWEKEDYGKHSKEINYFELPMTEELEIAINNEKEVKK